MIICMNNIIDFFVIRFIFFHGRTQKGGNELDIQMGDVQIVSNILTNKTRIKEGNYFYELLSEQPNFELMQIETTLWINDMILLSPLKVKRTKIKYTKVNENDYLVLFQIEPRLLDEGYIEIGTVIRADGTIPSTTAYPVDMDNYPEITNISLTLQFIPEWWHEMDLMEITYVDEKKTQYDATRKYKCIYGN